MSYLKIVILSSLGLLANFHFSSAQENNYFSLAIEGASYVSLSKAYLPSVTQTLDYGRQYHGVGLIYNPFMPKSISMDLKRKINENFSMGVCAGVQNWQVPDVFIFNGADYFSDLVVIPASLSFDYRTTISGGYGMTFRAELGYNVNNKYSRVTTFSTYYYDYMKASYMFNLGVSIQKIRPRRLVQLAFYPEAQFTGFKSWGHSYNEVKGIQNSYNHYSNLFFLGLKIKLSLDLKKKDGHFPEK